MAKPRMTDLSDLLVAKKTPTPQPVLAPVAEESKPAPQKDRKPSAVKTDQAAAARPRTTPSDVADVDKTPAASAPAPGEVVPRYLRLMRKETRISQAQADQLSSTVRSLNQARRGEGERITDNTLIRVAIGLLLERLDDLQGTTEAQLFQSLGLDPIE
jgi:hypothetical protein